MTDGSENVSRLPNTADLEAMTRAAIQEEIGRLERVWMSAVQHRDLATLELVLGEEFTLTTGRGGHEVRTREEYLRVTRDEYSVESFQVDELHVRVYGRVAVAQSRYSQTGSMAGNDRTATFRMTDVWVWRDGRWQAVARHANPVM